MKSQSNQSCPDENRVASAGLLEEKVAIVTGGASGIGKEIALAFAREGARVIIADLDHAAAESAAAEIDPVSGGRLA